MLTDQNNNPRKIFGKIEWPLAVLFAIIPLLVIVALLKSSGAI